MITYYLVRPHTTKQAIDKRWVRKAGNGRDNSSRQWIRVSELQPGGHPIMKVMNVRVHS